MSKSKKPNSYALFAHDIKHVVKEDTDAFYDKPFTLVCPESESESQTGKESRAAQLPDLYGQTMSLRELMRELTPSMNIMLKVSIAWKLLSQKDRQLVSAHSETRADEVRSREIAKVDLYCVNIQLALILLRGTGLYITKREEDKSDNDESDDESEDEGEDVDVMEKREAVNVSMLANYMNPKLSYDSITDMMIANREATGIAMTQRTLPA
jgi:hypothetical protein